MDGPVLGRDRLAGPGRAAEAEALAADRPHGVLAGGEAGMRHFMAQFGPCLAWPWTRLTDVPEFNEELVDLIAGQSDDQSARWSIRELERIRDDNLVAIMDALSRQNDGEGWGAGALQKDYVARLLAAARSEKA